MTGESLINNTFDVMGKRMAQGSSGMIDSLFKPGILEVLGALMVILIIGYGIYKIGKKRR